MQVAVVRPGGWRHLDSGLAGGGTLIVAWRDWRHLDSGLAGGSAMVG